MRVYVEYVFWFKVAARLPLRLQIKLLKLSDWFERRRP